MKLIKKKQIFAVFLGTITEYYDYSLYGFSAAIIAIQFFPLSDPITALMQVFAVYAVSYIFKPFGSLLFGYIGDNYGRKTALNITILGIAMPTIIIGILPNYAAIGIASTFILILCRILQGIFLGGEYDGAAIYVIEHLGEKYKSTASAITRATGVLGLLLGIASTNFFNAHIFPEWGWRIPFLLSLPLSLITLYYRRFLVESPVFVSSKQHKVVTKKFTVLIKEYWRQILIVTLLAGGFGVTYQISIIFIKSYLPLVLPQTGIIISSFSILTVLCFGIFMPISGFFADKYGTLKVIKIAVVGTFVACLLFAVAIKYQMLNLALGSCLMLAASVAPFNCLAHSLVINLFPVNSRYRAIGIGHALGSMLMSGSANYICLAFIRDYQFDLFPILYVSLFTIITYVMSWLCVRTKK